MFRVTLIVPRSWIIAIRGITLAARQAAMVASVTIVKLELAPARGVRIAWVRPGAAQVAIIPQPVFCVPAGCCGLGERVTAPAAGGMGDGF